MKTRLIKIGNSRGVRIPKPLLESAGLTGEVELTLEGGALLLKPASVRAGWTEAFTAMAEAGDDALLDADTETSFDEAWEW